MADTGQIINRHIPYGETDTSGYMSLFWPTIHCLQPFQVAAKELSLDDVVSKAKGFLSLITSLTQVERWQMLGFTYKVELTSAPLEQDELQEEDRDSKAPSRHMPRPAPHAKRKGTKGIKGPRPR